MALRLVAATSRPLFAFSTPALATFALRRAIYFRPAPLLPPSALQRSSERSFRSTSHRRATEGDDYHAFVESLKNSPAMAKITQSPGAMEALQKLAEFMKKSGINMTSKPSMFTMLKLTSSPEFRELAKNAMDEFKKAGIEVNRDTLSELFGPRIGGSK